MDAATLWILLGALVALALAVVAVRRRRRVHHYERVPADRLGRIAEEKARHYLQQHKESTGTEIDYTQESLKKLDEVLEKNFTQNTLDGHTMENMGMYLGETIRRLFGGRWKYNSGFGELCIDLPEEGFIFPVSHIRRALEHKETGQIYSYVESIAERQEAARAGG